MRTSLAPVGWDVDLLALYVRRGKIKPGPKLTPAQVDFHVREAFVAKEREKKALQRARRVP